MTSARQSTRATLHFPLNFFNARQGGLAKAVLTRADALAETGEFDGIWIEVLRWENDLAAVVKRRKKEGRLHPSIKVRSVLHTLDRSPAKAPGLSVSNLWDPDGDPRKTRAIEDEAGRITRLEHLSPTGDVLRRDEFNRQGKFVRSVDFEPQSGNVCAERWIGRSGQPFLSIEVDPETSTWLRADVAANDVVSFGNTRDLYRRAFDEAIAGEPLPIVFSEFRDRLTVLPSSNVDEVIARLEHPNLRNVAVVHSNHRLPPFVSGAPVLELWQSLLNHTDDWDATVVWTEQQRNEILAEFGSDARIEVIAPPSAPARESQTAYDDRRVVLVSRIHHKKRVDEAVRVFAKLLDRVPDARLDFYGFGYGNEAEAEVRDLVDSLGLEGRWHFKGFVEDPSEIYEQACATILTSDSEGFGMVLLESMTYGVPVVAFDSPYGPRDAIVDGDNGFLIERGDHDAFADRLAEIMTDRGLRARLANGAFETPSRFDPKLFVDRWQSLLGRVAEERVGTRPAGTRPLLRSIEVVDGMVELALSLPADLNDPLIVFGEEYRELTTAVCAGRARFKLKELPRRQSALRLRAGGPGVPDMTVKSALSNIELPRGLELGAGDDGAAFLGRVRFVALSGATKRAADWLRRLKAKAKAKAAARR